MKKLLLIGGSGGIGSALLPRLQEHYEVSAPSSKDLNLRDAESVESYFRTNEPDIIIHSAVKNCNSTIHGLDQSDIFLQIDNNVTGIANLLRYALPGMRDRNYGRIVYLSSVLSQLPIRGTGMYAASKAFAETLVRVAAIENAGHHVTCNSIRLGYFDVGIINQVPEAILEKVIAGIPLKRLGTVEEIFHMIQLIIDTEYITGSTLDLSGGMK